jgi:Fe-S-cluster containining protein
MTWIRHGECNGCGACCRTLVQHIEVRVPVPPLGADYQAARGFAIAADGTALLRGMLVSPCPQLTLENRCRLHPVWNGAESVKPQHCQDYPTAPEQITAYPCSYWFERDGERVGGQASPYPVEVGHR